MNGDAPIDLSVMLTGGVAIVVATADADRKPALTRGWGPSYDPVADSVALTVTAPAGSPTLANLELNGAIAVTISEPLTYRTVQLKGVVKHVQAPSESDRTRAHAHLAKFVAEVAELGLPDDVDRLFLGDLRLISFEIVESFLQTPGDQAGSELK